jgi:hypothetical protein
LAAAAIQGHHELCAQALAHRMLGDEPFELGHHVGVAAERQVGVDALLQRRKVSLLEPRDLGLRERLVRNVGQGRPAPHGERLAQAGGGVDRPPVRERLATLVREPLEPVYIELAVPHLERVAVVPRLQPLPGAVLECAAQLADVVLENLRRGGRRRLAPQGVDQPLARDRHVAMQQEQDEHGALPALSERKGAIAVADLKRSQQAKEHASDLLRRTVEQRPRRMQQHSWAAGGREMGANGRFMTGAHDRRGTHRTTRSQPPRSAQCAPPASSPSCSPPSSPWRSSPGLPRPFPRT